MKTPLYRVCALLAMLMLTSSPASGDGLNLTWNDCAAAGGLQNATFACGSNLGLQSLYASFVPPSGVAPVKSMEFIVDLLTENTLYTPWWFFKGFGACRPVNSLAANASFGSEVGCTDAWRGFSTITTLAQTVHFEDIGNRSRIIVTVALIDSTAAGTVVPPNEYYALKCVLSHAGTTGSSACAGCTDKVCLVLNSVRLVQLGGLGDVVITNEASSRTATWQGEVAGTCVPVPARNRTWGTIKSLYR